MIVTIDGPAGAGKSSTARRLAERLGFDFLDTGAMYRAVTLAGLRAHIRFDEASLTRLLEHFSLEMPPGQVLLDGEDVSLEIRTAQVTAQSAAVANSPVVRGRMVQRQRELAENRDIVCEGRDQGTLVFPQAACKFFLVADPVARARRRFLELQARGETITLEQVLADQQARDERDAVRNIAPMVPAADAILLDSTHLGRDEVVERMYQEVRRRQS